MTTRTKRGRDLSTIHEKPIGPFSTGSSPLDGGASTTIFPQMSTSSSSSSNGGGAALLSSSSVAGSGGWKDQLGKLQSMLQSEGEALEAREEELRRTREVSRLAAEKIHYMKQNNHFVTLCVGGTDFTVHVHTLLADEGSLFETMLSKTFRVEIDRSWKRQQQQREAAGLNSGSIKKHEKKSSKSANAAGHTTGHSFSSSSSSSVFVPSSMSVTSSPPILIDRDPESFKYILNYLRGYKKISISEDEKQLVLEDIDYYNLPKMRAFLIGCSSPAPAGSAASTTLTAEPVDYTQRLLPGPGVNVEGNRLRVAYAVSPVGEPMLVAGRHVISYEILSGEYIGLGVISESCKITDGEFHKTLNCCVYYMTGVFYSNFPNQKKEEGLAKYSTPDTVTMILDMDDKTIEYIVNGFTTKIVSCASASRLKFAVVGKLKSGVNIVNSDPFYVEGGQGQVMPSADYVPSFNPDLHPKPENTGAEGEDEDEEGEEDGERQPHQERMEEVSPLQFQQLQPQQSQHPQMVAPVHQQPRLLPAQTIMRRNTGGVGDGRSPTERGTGPRVSSRNSNSSLLARASLQLGAEGESQQPQLGMPLPQQPVQPPHTQLPQNLSTDQQLPSAGPGSPLMANPRPTQLNVGASSSGSLGALPQQPPQP